MLKVFKVICTAPVHPENQVWGYELDARGKKTHLFGLGNRYNSSRIRCDGCGRMMKPQYLYGAVQYCDECYTEYDKAPVDMKDYPPSGVDYGDGLGYRFK